MYEEPVVYVDVETTGGKPGISRIIEVAAIRVEGGKTVAQFNTLVNPGVPLPFWVTKLTGITENDLNPAPTFAAIADQLQAVLEGAVFIAHNVRFDYAFIRNELQACRQEFRPKLLCTVRLSRALYPDAHGHSLEKIIARHNLQTATRHRALADALAIKDFAEIAYHAKGEEAFRQALSRQFKTRSLPPNLSEQDFQQLKNKPGVYVLEDEAGQPLYVGKSITIRNRLLSHFNQDGKSSKEMKLALAAHYVRAIETGSELEALLLESNLVKELLPLHNRQLRRRRCHSVLVKTITTEGYLALRLEDRNVAAFDDLDQVYGVYPGRRHAKAALEEKLRTYDLCPKLLGLEKPNGSCFAYHLGKCRGACTGKESSEIYNRRVEIALERTKVESWPYASPVLIDTGGGRSVVVDRWAVLGFVEETNDKQPRFEKSEQGFDIDTYRILRSYLKQHVKSLAVRPISWQGLRQLAALSVGRTGALPYTGTNGSK